MLITTLLYIVIIYTISKLTFFNKYSIHKYAMPFFFSLKVIAGIALYFIYTYYYTDKSTGDVNKYFDDAKIIYNIIGNNYADYWKIILNIDGDNPTMQKYFSAISHWELNGNSNLINDARTIIRFNLLLLPISSGYYYFHSLIINLLSFIGLTFIYNIFCSENAHKKLLFSISCFLLPSLVFWCSGVLKEGLLIFFIGVTFHYTYKIFILKKGNIISNLLLLSIGMFGILITKFYVLFALVPGLLFLLLNKLFRLKTLHSIYGVIIIIVFALLIDSITINKILKPLSSKQKEFVNVAKGGYYCEVNSNKKVDTIYIDYNQKDKLAFYPNNKIKLDISTKVNYYTNLRLGENYNVNLNESYTLIKSIIPAKSYIHLPILTGKVINLFSVMPFAFYNTLFRPTLLEIKSALYIMPALENLLFVLSLLLIAFKRDSIIKEQETFLVFCLWFVVSIVIIVGITTPILGALVRYKVPMLPFLFFVISSLLPNKTRLKISK